MGSVADRLRAAAWDIVRDEAGNRLVSPMSLAIALGVIAEGATGGTEAALDKFFGVGDAERRHSLGQWLASLGSYDSLPASVDVDDPPENPVLHIASQVAVAGGDVEPQFAETIDRHLCAEVSHVPTWRDLKPELDEFARSHSAQLIAESAIVPDPAMLLVVQNVLFFAASWRQKLASTVMEFHSPSGPSSVDAMTGTVACKMVEAPGFVAIRLPFTERFAMDVILPGGSVSGLASGDFREASEQLDAAIESQVALTMPVSDQTSSLDMAPHLSSLGIVPGSYDRMFDKAVVQAVHQQARLRVGPHGAVGAALTEIAMTRSAHVEPVLRMVVDRPYALQVVDLDHGWPLFLAAIEAPTATV